MSSSSSGKKENEEYGKGGRARDGHQLVVESGASVSPPVAGSCGPLARVWLSSVRLLELGGSEHLLAWRSSGEFLFLASECKLIRYPWLAKSRGSTDL